MTKDELLKIWGHLHSWKNELQRKAQEAATSENSQGANVAADYMKMYNEITALQMAIDAEVLKMPD